MSLIVLGGWLALICLSGGLWVRNCIKYIIWKGMHKIDIDKKN